MAERNDPSSLLHKAAKAALAPLGAQRRGRSRFWYVDNGWYAIAIEFTRASFAQGAGLTLGVCWFWSAKASWSFDALVEHAPYVAFDTAERFAPKIAGIAEMAARHVVATQAVLQTLQSAYEATQPTTPAGNWEHVHSGVLAALLHKTGAATRHLQDAIGPTDGIGWRIERNEFCETLLAHLAAGRDCRTLIETRIRMGRGLLDLPAQAGPVLPGGRAPA